MSGQPFNKYAKIIQLCFPKDILNTPIYAIINNIGSIKFYDSFSISFTEQFIESALRSAQVAAALNVVGVPFEMPKTQQFLVDVYDEYKSTFDFIENIGSVLGKAYQKGTAFLDKTLHINLLSKVHKIGVVLNPEYREFWKGQEAELASYSQKVFGDNHLMSNYVHVAELYFSIQIKNTDRDENRKRHDTLIQSQKITARIKRKLRNYERNPVNVYGDILYYTFGEGNKYIDKHGIYEGATVFEELSSAGINITEWRDKLNALRLFATALDKVNLSTLDDRTETTIDRMNTMYNSELKPTFRVIQGIVDKQQKAIAELESEITRNQETIEKSRIMTSDPTDLTEDERTFQNNTFIKQLDSAIPGVSDRFKFKTFDIKEFTDE